MVGSEYPVPTQARPVVIFTNAWAMGGLEKNILDLSHELVRRGHRVAVICYAGNAIAPLRDGLREGGVDVYLWNVPWVRGRLAGLRYLIRIFRAYPGCIVHLIEGWPAGTAW